MLVAGGEYGYEVRQKLQHKDSIMDDINNDDDDDADDDDRVRKNRNEKRKRYTYPSSINLSRLFVRFVVCTYSSLGKCYLIYVSTMDARQSCSSYCFSFCCCLYCYTSTHRRRFDFFSTTCGRALSS